MNKRTIEDPEEISLEGIGQYKYFIPENKCILLDQEITPEVASTLMDNLLYADSSEDEEPILLFINSPGGDVYSTLMMIDLIKSIRTPVTGLVTGLAASGAFYLLQACDRRMMSPSSYLFWHQIISSGQEIHTQHEMVKYQKQYQRMNEQLENMLKQRARITTTNWKKYFSTDNDIFFSSDEALQLNLIDEILPIAKAPLQKKKIKK